MKRLVKIILIFTVVIAVGIGAYLLWYAKESSEYKVPIKKINIKEAVYGIGTLTANKIYQLKIGVESSVEKVIKIEGDKAAEGEPLISLQGLSTFKAPFSGTVTSVSVKPGENVNANQPILTLTDLSDVYLTVRLEQSGVAKVKLGQTARISFEAVKDLVFTGRVKAIYSNGGDFIVQVTVESPSDVLLPGMTADVGIEVAERQGVWAIPLWALSAGDEITIATRNGTKKTLKSTTGLSSEEMVEIRAEDLSEGDMLVTKRQPPKTN